MTVLSQSLAAAKLRLQSAPDATDKRAESHPTPCVLGSPIPGEISPDDAEEAPVVLPDRPGFSAPLCDRLIRAFCVAHNNENRTGA